MGEVIVAEGLTKRFGSLVAVNGVSFEVRRGEIFGFLGPNGAGKTTTINMLITLIKPSSGRAFVAGYDVAREPEKVRSRIGVVFQDTSVDRDLTGWENLWLHGMVYGVPRDRLRERITELLDFVELSRFRDVLVKNYSGGMVRRLEIARALVHEPEILFLDEPTIGLDPQTRARIWDYIVELRRKHGLTVFLTTHYMDEAERLCDRVAIIDHGRIVAIGSPGELKRMVGSEALYLRLGDPAGAEEFAKEVVEEGLASEYKRVEDDLLVFKVEAVEETLPEILRMAESRGLRVKEARYTKPSLGDVFLYLTGRELRDEGETGWKRLASMRMRLRR